MSVDDLARAADGALARLIAARHKEALGEAYRRHSGPVYNFARRLVIDPRLAEEVLQEIFLDLWRCPERYDPDRGTLASYLLSRTHGRSIDLLRSELARRRREEKEALQQLEFTSGLETSVVDLVTAEEVRRLMAGLSDQVRRAIELAFYEGHTYARVAAIMGQPEGTVKSWIRGGLKRLRQELSADRPRPGDG